MKPLHELDERVVVAGMVVPRSLKGRHQECPRRPLPWWIGQDDIENGSVEEPEVSSQSRYIGANGDDPLPMPLRLVLNHKDDEVGKVDDVPEAAPGAKVYHYFEGQKCMWRVRACNSFSSLNSSVYKPSAAPNSGALSWRTNPPRRNWTVPGLS
ncbi:hypothetical protein GOBAR_AA06686 [Gossypium barbadense]|uniref:Uncharacterized protein n=1 Tax=Gossypium barbadense TaxID=3634 RepID=A0A2P5YE66_GOSBA|nr:hypothetical protein GOBAR_AA06686 [Gossypium barbadense]